MLADRTGGWGGGRSGAVAPLTPPAVTAAGLTLAVCCVCNLCRSSSMLSDTAGAATPAGAAAAPVATAAAAWVG